MCTSIDIPEEQLEELDRIAKARKLSRAAVICEAISIYLTEYRRVPGDAFGIWSDREIDGLEYQRKLRDEW